MKVPKHMQITADTKIEEGFTSRTEARGYAMASQKSFFARIPGYANILKFLRDGNCIETQVKA